MRIVTFGIAAVFAALVLQGSLTSEAAEKSQKGQTQKQHYGRGLDIAAVDGQPASTKRTVISSIAFSSLRASRPSNGRKTI